MEVGVIISLTCKPPFTLQEDSWDSFLLEAELTPRATMQLERLGQLKNAMASLGIKPVLCQLEA
jgi:hypothetical protein